MAEHCFRQACDPCFRPESGFILIAVLWISLLLSVFALNLSTKSRLAGEQAMNVQKLALSDQYFGSALAKGRHELLRYEANKGLLEHREEWEKSTGKKLELWFPRYEPYELTLDGETYKVRIVSRSGKLDINRIDLQRLTEIIQVCGASSGVETTAIANSIVDWMDADDLERAEGAEKDYYLSLEDPYLPKDAAVQDIRELLLVKGVSRDIFYGTDDHPGLIHFLGASGAEEKMDINSAAPETFAVLENMPPEALDEIISRRQSQPIESLAELGEIIPQGMFDELQSFYTVSSQGGFEISAFRVTEDGRAARGVSVGI